MQPVKKWVENEGKIVYSPTQEFKNELIGESKGMIVEYRAQGKINMIDKKAVKNMQNNLPKLKSNDSHIIALALVAKVRLLVTGDKDLHEDFKNIIPKGKIYQNKKHKHLLTNHSCP